MRGEGAYGYEKRRIYRDKNLTVLKPANGAYNSTKLFSGVVRIRWRALIFIISAALIFCCYVSVGIERAENGDTELSESDTGADKTSAERSEAGYTSLNYETVKAVWLSQFDMTPIYTDGGAQRSIADYTARADKVIENVKSLGMNTVFVQLRPNGDSIYPSELYPMSKYVTGKYGRETEYDVFAVFLELAHRAGLSVHAWINPLRCMSESEISEVPLRYDIRRWYAEENGRYIVTVDGVCYLNPAYAEVRELICRGAMEIIERYEVDGLHMDDYFYPTTAVSFDAAAYAEYRESGILSLADFRREQINTLVRDIYATVKNKNHTVLFGISPGGNTDRNYNELYADVAKWCANDGYIDYICPQVYFGFEHESRPFDKVCEEFADMIKTDSVSLIIGMTLGKAYSGYSGVEDVWAGTGSREWIENRDILRRSIEYVRSVENCQGAAFFSYQYFFDSISGERILQTENECGGLVSALKKMK